MIVREAFPGPAKGVDFSKVKDQVVPDQSLKLQDIIQRFVRREALAVGHPSHYGSDGSMDPESESEFNIDQEKAKYWDLTEKKEFIDSVMSARSEMEGKVKAKKEAKAKAEADARARKEADDFDRKAREYVAKNPGGKPGSI